MNATTLFIQQRLRKFETDCRQAMAQISRMGTIPDVVRAARVRPPAELRGITGATPFYRQMKSEVARKLETLLDAQLKEVAALKDTEERKAVIGRFRHMQWDYLRGEHATLYRKADMTSRRLLAS